MSTPELRLQSRRATQTRAERIHPCHLPPPSLVHPVYLVYRR